ncbi:hypothetical protein AB3N60_01285 [Leptospira sp. WS39.C2]
MKHLKTICILDILAGFVILSTTIQNNQQFSSDQSYEIVMIKFLTILSTLNFVFATFLNLYVLNGKKLSKNFIFVFALIPILLTCLNLIYNFYQIVYLPYFNQETQDFQQSIGNNHNLMNTEETAEYLNQITTQLSLLEIVFVFGFAATLGIIRITWNIFWYKKISEKIRFD